MRRPLLITGGPAVGKSTCGRQLALERDRCAFIDVDDVRQLVVSGHVPPWDGDEGELQRTLGATNASSLVRNFHAAGIESVIVDVVTPGSLQTYRSMLEDLFVVHLQISLEGARQRAATRKIYLTDEEFDAFHERDRSSPPEADAVLRVDGLTVDQQVEWIEQRWAGAS